VEIYSYIRFSHKKQARGDSLRRQTEKRDALCQRRGWTLDDTLQLQDLGVSARRGRNAETGALAAFVKAVEGGQVKPGSVLIVESLDRLTRDFIMEAVELFMSLLRLGITICTVDPEREYSRKSLNDQPFTLFEPILIFIRANEENERRIGRVAASWEKRRRHAKERPMTSRCPGWLRYVKGRFEPVPEKAAVVKRIFQMVLDGESVIRIAKILNQEGVKPFNKRTWEGDYVGKILRSKLVLGEMQPKKREGWRRVKAGEAIPNYYPAVIDLETFYRVQGILNNRSGFRGRTGKHVTNLFSGLLRDARDGLPMRIRVSQTMKQLVSSGALRGEPGSLYVSFPYNFFEFGFLNFVEEVKMETPKKNNLDAEIESLEGQISENKERVKRIQEALLTEKDLAPLVEVLKTLTDQGKNLQEHVDRLRGEKARDAGSDLQGLKSLLEHWQEAEEAGKLEEFRVRLRNKIRSVVSSIWVLTGADSRYHRRATVQVFFRAGGWRFMQIEYTSRGKKAGTEYLSGTAEELGLADYDLPHYRFLPEAAK
jgi:DNA invertase Pin-like site-specific DNA recombinase